MKIVSAEDTELHRRFYWAVNGDDDSELVALCDPHIEVRSVFAAVGGAVYRGHAGVRKWRRDLAESWGPEFRVEPQVFFDAGERTVALVVLHGRGGKSGIEVAMPATGIATWRDGLCISHKGYASQDEALAELGVSLDALEPVPPGAPAPPASEVPPRQAPGAVDANGETRTVGRARGDAQAASGPGRARWGRRSKR